MAGLERSTSAREQPGARVATAYTDDSGQAGTRRTAYAGTCGRLGVRGTFRTAYIPVPLQCSFRVAAVAELVYAMAEPFTLVHDGVADRLTLRLS